MTDCGGSRTEILLQYVPKQVLMLLTVTMKTCHYRFTQEGHSDYYNDLVLRVLVSKLAQKIEQVSFLKQLLFDFK